MRLRWSRAALSDLVRLHDFLATVNPTAAASVIRNLTAAPDRLAAHPRMGERLEEFEPRELRRIIVGQYELRYEIAADTLTIVRLWHTREKR